jgi:hypothetical protein
MANLDQVIDYTKLFQDIELSTALQQLRNNPGQLQQYLQSQQDNVYKEVTKQKDESFQKVYGDLQRASTAQESILMYNERNKQLNSLQDQIYNQQKKNASAVTYDKDLAGRKYEMNQWSINNKKDSLFVYSQLFIILCTAIIFTYVWRKGMIGSTLYVALLTPLLIIFTFTVVDRSQYTDVLRNNRYWNRRTFKGKYGKIPLPICPGALTGLESGLNSLESDAAGVAAGAAGMAASAAQGVAGGISSAANSMAASASTLSNNLSNTK